ncbi:Tn3 family transposase [uncultured Pseudonocardia sp.]|uniref:Tn3 family transposase n=1 Tax=uncultured Pseudonocardia sp. TaxID=211455 RepID=UPI00262E7C56|nr:Tn3 family transposase [uncultured Pseudonocardia sp.]
MRRRAEMDVQANYVDSHGHSEIGLELTRLMGLELTPRLSRINHQLHVPDVETRARPRC